MTKTYNVAICATYIFAILPVHVYPFIEEEKKATFLTASVGDSVVFNCQLDFPHDVIIPYILYWKKEGKTVFSWHEGVLYASDAFEHRIGLLPPDSPYGKGSINLTSIRETDAGWYECRVLFPNRSPSSRLNGTWFHLTVDGGNLLGIPPINQTVMEGQQAHFSCVTKDSEATVTWYKDGVPLSEIPNLMGRSFISHEGSLTIRVTEMDDVGKFTCEISNKQGETQTATAFLDVQYEAKVIFSPQEKYLPHGKSAVLDCHSRANPPLKDVRWQKDGFLFDPYNVQGVFVRSNGSLYFSKVEEAHGGDYVCTPYNEIGTAGSSAPMRVIIQHPPVFTVTPHNLYLIKKGDSIEIPCDAVDGDGTHRPAIQWYKKDGSSLPTSRSFITGGNLTIANIEESDRGLYQCVATNEAATVAVETELIIENSQPRAPYNLTANSTTTSITLKWIPGYGKPQMEYSVWFRKLDVAEWRTTRIAKGANQVTINNLTPGHEYELMVLSQDQRGDGMFSKALRYKTKGPGVHKENEFKKPLETFQQIGPPLNVRVNIDVEGYKVSWDPPEFGAELLRVYTVSWYEGDNENDIVKADTSGTSFIVKDLEENKSYHFQVTAMSTNDYESSSERFTIYVPDYHRARAINIGVAVGLMLIFATAAGIWYVRNVYRRTNHKSHFDDS